MDGHFGTGENPIQSKIQGDVAARGWSWIWVFDPDEKSSPFAYTIGFSTTFGHPEVVVAGLPEKTSEGILNAVHDELENGAVFGDGDVSDEVLEAFTVCFREVPTDLLSDALGQAVEFYGSRNFEAVQLYWPDREGHFPGDEDAPVWLNERQSLRS